MPDRQRYTQLPQAIALDGTEIVAVDQLNGLPNGSRTTRQTTTQAVADLALGGVTGELMYLTLEDATAAEWQAAIDEISGATLTGPRTNKRVWVTGMDGAIEETVTFPNRTWGGVFFGNSNGETLQSGANIPKGPRSVVRWTGDAGGTMFVADGCAEQDFDHIAFFGANDDGAGPMADYFWKSTYTPESGAGVATLDTIYWAYFDTIYALGLGARDEGAADFRWVKCSAGSCRVFVETWNANVVNLVFEVFNCGDLVTMVDTTNGGGSIRIRSLNASRCGAGATGAVGTEYFLDLSQSEGSAETLIDGVRWELDSKHFLKANQGLYDIRGFNESQDNQEDTLVYVQGANVKFSSSRFFTHGGVGLSTFLLESGSSPGTEGFLHLTDCTFDFGTQGEFIFSEWFRFSSVNSRCDLKVENCFYGDSPFQQMPFINSNPNFGPVTHQAHTLNATQTRATFTGTTTAAYYNVCKLEEDSYWSFLVKVVAVQSGGSVVAEFWRRVLVQCLSGTVTVLSAVAVGSDVNPGAWGGGTPVAFAADPDGRLGFYCLVTGAAATDIYWSITMDGATMNFLYER